MGIISNSKIQIPKTIKGLNTSNISLRYTLYFVQHKANNYRLQTKDLNMPD